MLTQVTNLDLIQILVQEATNLILKKYWISALKIFSRNKDKTKERNNKV
jgi:hypothetical protein